MAYDFVTLKCSVKMSPMKEIVISMRKMPRGIPFYCKLREGLRDYATPLKTDRE